MRNLGTSGCLDDLVARVQRVTPDSARLWGKMNAQQMLLHLGGASAAALGQKEFVIKPRPGGAVVRFVLFYLMRRYPRDIRVGSNPAGRAVDPSDFDRDRQRVIDLLRAMAAPDASLVPRHPIFGRMSRGSWLRWAYMHTDHHLRQFGV